MDACRNRATSKDELNTLCMEIMVCDDQDDII